MKLIVLCDNNTYIDNYLLGEPALSFYIENENDKILLDLGYSNVYKTNAKKLGIDLSHVGKIAFSHGHDDHTKGLTYFNFNSSPTIFYCPGCFEKKKSATCFIGSPYSEQSIGSRFKLSKTNKPVEISKNLYYLGPIPRKHAHEQEPSNTYKLKNNKWVADNLDDDTAMVYVGENGLSIITGCSHSGICNICDYAKQLFGKNINLIIGGLHLLDLNNKATKTIDYLKKENINVLYPSHCTSLAVKSEMINQGLNVKEVGSGLILEIK